MYEQGLYEQGDVSVAHTRRRQSRLALTHNANALDAVCFRPELAATSYPLRCPQLAPIFESLGHPRGRISSFGGRVVDILVPGVIALICASLALLPESQAVPLPLTERSLAGQLAAILRELLSDTAPRRYTDDFERVRGYMQTLTRLDDEAR